VECYEGSKRRDGDAGKQKVAEIQHVKYDTRAGHYLNPGARAELHRNASEAGHAFIPRFEYFIESEMPTLGHSFEIERFQENKKEIKIKAYSIAHRKKYEPKTRN
jgi:hypothetical protein